MKGFALVPPESPNIELQPESQEPGSMSRLVLWLVAVSVGILLLPLFLVSTTIKEDNLRLEEELIQLQATLDTEPQPNPEEQALRDTLLEVKNNLNAIELVQAALMESHIDWPLAIATIAQYDQGRLSLTNLTQTEYLIVLHGRAEDEEIVIAYTNWLRNSGHFARVDVQSITLITPPTPKANNREATPTPGPEKPQKYADFIIQLELKVNNHESG